MWTNTDKKCPECGHEIVYLEEYNRFECRMNMPYQGCGYSWKGMSALAAEKVIGRLGDIIEEQDKLIEKLDTRIMFLEWQLNEME